MNRKSKSFKPTSVAVWLSMTFLAVSYVWIGLAYAAQLSSDAPPPFTNQFVRGDMTMRGETKPPLKFIAPDGTVVSKRFMGELLASAEADRGKLVWGMYPASVRGRVFSGAREIGTPFASSGGW